MSMPVSRRPVSVTPEMMLKAYRLGLFPMAETRHGARLYWLDPEQRGILPLDRFHCPRKLGRLALSNRFTVTADRDFPAVIAGCAAARDGRDETWINADIESLFIELASRGHAHSIETRLDGALVGGLYGVVIGGAFFGESMFSTVTDSSKVALVHLVARLHLAGFTLLDTQFVTSHLARFGAIEIPRADYKLMLAAAAASPATWIADPDPCDLTAAIERLRTNRLEPPPCAAPS
jgi:leucyl/phenylalanyl-tRNA--protein transferase